MHALSASCKAFWPHRFHGIEPSKKSKEKAQRKQRDEMAAKKLATSEQPTGSFNHLKNAQVIVPYDLSCPLPNGAFSILAARGPPASMSHQQPCMYASCSHLVMLDLFPHVHRCLSRFNLCRQLDYVQ